MSHLALLISWRLGYYVYHKRNSIEVYGKENVPQGVRILFVANHQTLTDSWGVGVNVITYEDACRHYDWIPWNAPDKANFFRNSIYRFVFGLLKNVPTIRGSRSRQVIDEQVAKYVDVLKDGNLLLFFEGTRSRDSNIGPCRSGVQLVVQRSKPDYIIPVRLVDTHAVMPIEAGFNWLKIGHNVKGKIIIGKIIEFSEADFDDRKLIGHKIREAVVALYL